MSAVIWTLIDQSGRMFEHFNCTNFINHRVGARLLSLILNIPSFRPQCLEVQWCRSHRDSKVATTFDFKNYLIRKQYNNITLCVFLAWSSVFTLKEYFCWFGSQSRNNKYWNEFHVFNVLIVSKCTFISLLHSCFNEFNFMVTSEMWKKFWRFYKKQSEVHHVGDSAGYF